MNGITKSLATAVVDSDPTEAQAAAGVVDYIRTPNKFVTVEGTKLAYRTLGNRSDAPPLVLFQHFTGTMDDWDQSMIEGLAKSRTVVVFENAGIGASEGKAPDSVATMARYAEGFLDALHLNKVDTLGFSLGGAVAQQVLADRPELVRKAILVGTGPQGAEGFKDLPNIISENLKKSAETKLHLKVLLCATGGQVESLSQCEPGGRTRRHLHSNYVWPGRSRQPIPEIWADKWCEGPPPFECTFYSREKTNRGLQFP